MKNVRLVVVYNKRVISIPFESIKNIDEFTMSYENKNELGKMLNDILNLKVKDVDVDKIYIKKINTKKTDNGISEYISYLPVKYEEDNFNFEAVKTGYVKYFLDDEKRLNWPPVGFDNIKQNYMRKYHKTSLNINDIYYIVSLYLGNNYERYREAYFTLINNGYKVLIDNYNVNNKRIDRTKIANYEAMSKYGEYLKQYATLGDEAEEKIVDMLSGYTPEELRRILHHDNYDLFDSGRIKSGKNIQDEAMALSALAGMSIDELTDLVLRYQRMIHNKGHRR